LQALARRLNQLCDEQPFSTWWYVKDLRTNEVAERGAREVVTSASTRKICILMAALSKVHDGTFSLDDPFVLEEKYQGNTSGCFQHFRPGTQIAFEDALLMMIIVSDNTCTGKIFDMLGIDYLNEYTRSIGMVGTTNRPRVEPELLAQDLPQARRVEHRPGPNDALPRQSGALGDDVGEYVDGVRDDDDEPPIAAQTRPDLARRPRVVAQQLEARLTGLPSAAGGDHDRVRLHHLLDRSRAHGRGRVERRAMGEIHRLTLRDVRPHVAEQELVRDSGVQRGDRDTRADPPDADDPDGGVHQQAVLGLTAPAGP
jgi:hypothetical protein